MAASARNGDGQFTKRTDESNGSGEGNPGVESNTEQSPDSIRTIDPTTVVPGGAGVGDPDSGSGDSGKRGRGRPPGSKRQKVPNIKSATLDNRQAVLDPNALADLLFSVHLALAAIAHSPAIALDQEESMKLSKASCNVMRHYDVKTTAKTMDWAQLFIALGIVYVPRIIMMKPKKKDIPIVENTPVDDLSAFNIPPLEQV